MLNRGCDGTTASMGPIDWAVPPDGGMGAEAVPKQWTVVWDRGLTSSRGMPANAVTLCGHS